MRVPREASCSVLLPPCPHFPLPACLLSRRWAVSFVKTVIDGSHSFVSFVFLGFLLFSLVRRGPWADTFSESRDVDGVRTTGRGWDGVVEGRRQSWFWASVHPIHPRSEEVGM